MFHFYTSRKRHKTKNFLTFSGGIEMVESFYHILQNLGIIHLVRAKIFWETIISHPLVHTRTCTYHGVRNVSFPVNFCVCTPQRSLIEPDFEADLQNSCSTDFGTIASRYYVEVHFQNFCEQTDTYDMFYSERQLQFPWKQVDTFQKFFLDLEKNI